MSVHWSLAVPGDFAVIGDPVGHSRSPVMFRAAFQALGLPHRYNAIQVPREEFDEALEHLINLGYRGLNVTVPLKQEAHRWAQSIDQESLVYGSINTLDLIGRGGINTDAPGFLDTLGWLNIRPPGPALLLGAGGSARALLIALNEASFDIRIYNRTRARAESLAADCDFEFEILDEPRVMDASLVINATSAGLSGEMLDIVWGKPVDECFAYDLLYGDKPSAFLKDAEMVGLRNCDGKHLLVAQGARSFEWWLSQKPPLETMWDAINL